ncbi:MAG: hypothetical protein JXQ29_16640 [Planctomycetes bacterium]|nr:hypothetical protein [Planctomycetota bacterium]
MRDGLMEQQRQALKADVTERCVSGVEDTVRRLYHRLAEGGHLVNVGPAMEVIRGGIRELAQEIAAAALDTLSHAEGRQRSLVQILAADLAAHDPDSETVFVIRDTATGRYQLDGYMLTDNLRWADRYATPGDASYELWMCGQAIGRVELVEVTRREAEPYVRPTKEFLAQERERLQAMAARDRESREA